MQSISSLPAQSLKQFSASSLRALCRTSSSFLHWPSAWCSQSRTQSLRSSFSSGTSSRNCSSLPLDTVLMLAPLTHLLRTSESQVDKILIPLSIYDVGLQGTGLFLGVGLEHFSACNRRRRGRGRMPWTGHWSTVHNTDRNRELISMPRGNACFWNVKEIRMNSEIQTPLDVSDEDAVLPYHGPSSFSVSV